MNRHSRKPRGFTLIEMLIALLAGILVVSPLYFIVRHMSIQAGAQQMKTEANQRARFGMDALVRDFERIGLLSSPDCQKDYKCYSSSITGSPANFRRAVVHLNRGEEGNDGVLITGSFISGTGHVADYPAFSGAGNIPIVLREKIQNSECVENYNPRYSFAHIKAPDKRFVEAKIISVGWTDPVGNLGTCTVTIDGTGMSGASTILSPADVISVAANQTALYWVETLTEGGSTRSQLVRYFIDYDGDGGEDSDCEVVGALNVAAVTATLPNASAALPDTRRVIADYVTDFQVWFRPVTINSPWVEPHHYSVSEIEGAQSGNFSQGFVLEDAPYILPRTVGDADGILADLDNLSCVSQGAIPIGPERVRSVVVLIGVRTEKPEYSIDLAAFGSSRIVDRTLQGVGGGGDGGVPAAYGVRTFVTEIWLKNLASRGDLLNVSRNL